MKPKDQTVWIRISKYDFASIHSTEDDALDHRTRTDNVYKCQITGWELLP